MTAGKWIRHNGLVYKVKVTCTGVEPPNATYYEPQTIGSTLETLNSDTGWQNLTPPTGVTVNNGAFAYRKIGRIVTLIFDLSFTTVPNNNILANLPQDVTPSKVVPVGISSFNSQTKSAIFMCTFERKLLVYGAIAGERYGGTLTYPV